MGRARPSASSLGWRSGFSWEGASVGKAMACACESGAPVRIGDLGSAWFCPYFPGQVDDEKARLDPSFRATHAAVQACAGLSPATQSGWVQFYASWRELADRASPFFGACIEMDQVEKFARDLGGWQATMRTTRCDVPGPNPAPVDAPADFSAVKWVAAAAIVVAGVYAARLVLR
jgi:hypothetical protein